MLAIELRWLRVDASGIGRTAALLLNSSSARNDAVLISLLALLVLSVSAGVRSLLGDAPVVLQGPSTLELAVIGGGVVAVYALSSRRFRRREVRIERVASESQAIPPERTDLAEEPSRGAA